MSVGFLKVKLKVNKNSGGPRPGFIAYLFICFIYLLSDGYFVVVVFLNGISSLPMASFYVSPLVLKLMIPNTKTCLTKKYVFAITCW